MLNNICFKTDDLFWAGILSDLGANISDNGILFKAPAKKIHARELLDHVFGLRAARLKSLGAEGLSAAEQNLLLLLPRSAGELRAILGYVDDTKTHTIETLVYNIRKKLGRGFIKLENGEYRTEV